MLWFYWAVAFEAETTTPVAFVTVTLTEVASYSLVTSLQRVAEQICSGNTDSSPHKSDFYLTVLFSDEHIVGGEEKKKKERNKP